MLTFAVGCCSMDVSPHDFKNLPLDEQVKKWRQWHAAGCGGSEISHWYLDGMAQHGQPAADAMVPFLITSDPTFPQMDAIVVVRFASYGANLRNHPATAQLRVLLTDSPDPYIRKAAWSALREIDGVSPPLPN